jgi:uncharacterized membrane protein
MSLTLLYMFLGVLFIGLSVPMVLKKVPPNNWYGFRTPKTLSDTKIWYESNRIAGQGMLVVGVLVIVAALALYFLAGGLSDATKVIILIVVTLVSVAVAVIRSFMALSRM